MAIKGARPDERRVVAHLMVRNGAQALDWYTKVLNAKELYRYALPDGRIFHAQLKVSESVIMLTDEAMSATGRGPLPTKSPASLSGTTVILELYVEDADASYQKAINAGARVICPLMDTFFGDRYAQVIDPFGHCWAFSTVRETLSPEEVAKRLAARMTKP